MENKSNYEFNYRVTATMCPGEITSQEGFNAWGKEDLFSKITKWINNIESEIKVIPINRQLESQKQQIEILQEKIKDLPDEYITHEEGAKYQKALDDVEAKLSEHIKNELKGKKELEEKLQKLKTEIDMLRNTMFALRKQNWFKSLITRVGIWSSDPTNQKLLKSGVDLTRTFLPEFSFSDGENNDN